ncbi:MAG: hypothetical protein B6244_08965 [Candidatus Cloacimonetes bacterium 4572_55]|nr:MAG: hypothetical protein B6244_08965 [Candidatus Cloacimonetes bacterium 4572_55]
MTFNILFTLLYGLSGMVLILLGFAIYRDNPQERLNKITSLMLWWGGMGASFGGLDLLLQEIFQIQNWLDFQIYRELGAAIWEFFFPQLLLFALVFPTEYRLLRRFRWLPVAIFIPHLLHFLVIFVAPQLFVLYRAHISGQMTENLPEFLILFGSMLSKLIEVSLILHKKLFSIANIIFFLIALLTLSYNYNRIQQPHLKQQIRFVIVGICIAAGLYAALILLPVIFEFQIPLLLQSGLIATGLLIGSGSVAVSIIRYRFLDINLLLRKSIFYTFSAALIGGTYLMVIRYFDQMIQKIFGQEIPVLEIGFFLFALILFQPLMSGLETFMDKIFLRGGSDYRTAIQELSSEVLTILDFETLKQEVVERLSKSLMTDQVILYLKSLKSDCYVPVAWCKKMLEWTTFNEKSRLIKQIKNINEPILAKNLLRMVPDQQEALKLQELLKKLDVYLIVPIRRQGKMKGFITLGQKITKLRYTYEDMTLLNVLSAQLAVAIENIHLYEELAARERAKKEMEIAQRIQQVLSPPQYQTFPGIELSCITLPAIEVGGDYFDFFNLSSKRIGLVIGDVSGKGVFGAVYMAIVRSFVRAHALQDESPRETLVHVNSLLRRESDRRLFISLFYGIFDLENRTLLYARAGHNHPIFLNSKKNECVMLDGKGMALGIAGTSIFEPNLEEVEINVQDGDLLLLYTDGVTEAMDEQREEFTEERLIKLIRKNQRESARNLMDIILEDVNQFVGKAEQHDDMTLVSLKVLLAPTSDQLGKII